MAAIPTWLLGRHVTACAITPQTVAPDGTLSAAAGASSLVGSLDEIRLTSSPEKEEISPMTTRRKNSVIVKDGTQITVMEILKSNGTNLLAALIYSYDIFYITFTRGGQSWSGYFERGEYDEPIVRGKNVATLQLDSVDISSANPTYA